jgi:hypothetical protein
MTTAMPTLSAASGAAVLPGDHRRGVGPVAAPVRRVGGDTEAGRDVGPALVGPSVALAHADAVTTAMAALARSITSAVEWPAGDRRELLRRLDHAVDGLAVVRAAVLVAESESGAWQHTGDRSAAASRGRTSRLGERAAATQVRQAEQLGAVPAVAAAVTDGRIPLQHAAIIAKVATTGSPAQQRAAQSAEGQEHLLELARREDLGTFATTVARWSATTDPAGVERDHQQQRSERFVHVVDTARGTLVKGQLDLMSGQRFRRALEALSPRPAADDDRDPGQRAADALDAMSVKVLGLLDSKPGAHVPPQISMILTEETWVAARAERDRRRRATVPADRPTEKASPIVPPGGDRSAIRPSSDSAEAEDAVTADGLTDGQCYPPATLEDGTPVPVSELAAAMCDCEVTRIVVDATGVPLDLGRTERLFSGPQRRAVIARDRECAWPDCQMNARWCQIHHIRWWERDAGPTSVDNGVLLCSFHHHEVHRRDLSVERDGPGSTGSPPGATRPPPSPGDVVTRATYTFRDRSGGTIGESPGDAPMPVRDVVRGADRSGAPRSSVEPPDELPLTWTTDSFTGGRVPTWFVTA